MLNVAGKISFIHLPCRSLSMCILLRLFRNTYHMKNSKVSILLNNYIFLFFIASFAGFLWEILIYLVLQGKFFNRGFFYGSILPVYGCGAILIFGFLHKKRNRPVFCFFCSALIGAVIELFTGWFLQTVFHMRYWDYTGEFLNWNGYICLYSVLGFALAGMLFNCYAAPFLLACWNRLNLKIRHRILSVLILLFFVDFAAALLLPNSGDGITY